MEAITCAGYYAIVIIAIDTPTSGNAFHLFQRQFSSSFLRNGKEFFRGSCDFKLFLLFVGDGVENILGN